MRAYNEQVLPLPEEQRQEYQAGIQCLRIASYGAGNLSAHVKEFWKNMRNRQSLEVAYGTTELGGAVLKGTPSIEDHSKYFSEAYALVIPDPNITHRVGALVRLRPEKVTQLSLSTLREDLSQCLEAFKLPSALRVLTDDEQVLRMYSLEFAPKEALPRFFPVDEDCTVQSLSGKAELCDMSGDFLSYKALKYIFKADEVPTNWLRLPVQAQLTGCPTPIAEPRNWSDPLTREFLEERHNPGETVITPPPPSAGELLKEVSPLQDQVSSMDGRKYIAPKGIMVSISGGSVQLQRMNNEQRRHVYHLAQNKTRWTIMPATGFITLKLLNGEIHVPVRVVKRGTQFVNWVDDT
ncbi:hypothetical protein BJX99DRAFT_260376 [Aspergillus californicus]